MIDRAPPGNWESAIRLLIHPQQLLYTLKHGNVGMAEAIHLNRHELIILSKTRFVDFR